MQKQEIEQLLKEGIAAAQAGQKEQARQLLLQVIALDEEVEAAWLWLAGVVDEPEEEQICLENVLILNPGNTAAQRGLQQLRGQNLVSAVEPSSTRLPKIDDAQRPIQNVIPEVASPPVAPASSLAPLEVEIDAFGCPYCGGSISGAEPYCDHCGRSVEVRLHRRPGGAQLAQLAVLFLLLGIATWLEGHLVSQLTSADPFPDWVSRSALQLAIGRASFSPGGIPEDLANLARVVTGIHSVLAGLCIVTAAGLALRSKVVYFGSFLLAGLLVAASLAGLLTGLTGLLPTLLLVGLVAITVKWLTDSAFALEWQKRYYDAKIDRDLRNAPDYHNRGQHYVEMGMWAKAAAHWQVAAQLAPGQAQYHLSLARAYAQMDYPEAAMAEADRALALAPDDTKARRFRNSLANSPESSPPER